MCGATSGQKAIAAQQTDLSKQIMQQGSLIFGDSSHVFNDLMSTFSPTVAAGPNQMGFSAPELANLNSQAITNTGQAYRNASQAVKEASAAVGGGNLALPSGADIGRNLGVANAAAAQTAGELNQINQANYATGRQNYQQAVEGMTRAPGVFSPSISANGASINANEAAAQTQNQIAQQNNSWVNAVTGALGGVATVATGGLMKNLGKNNSSGTGSA